MITKKQSSNTIMSIPYRDYFKRFHKNNLATKSRLYFIKTLINGSISVVAKIKKVVLNSKSMQ